MLHYFLKYSLCCLLWSEANLCLRIGSEDGNRQLKELEIRKPRLKKRLDRLVFQNWTNLDSISTLCVPLHGYVQVKDAALDGFALPK